MKSGSDRQKRFMARRHRFRPVLLDYFFTRRMSILGYVCLMAARRKAWRKKFAYNAQYVSEFHYSVMQYALK